MERSSGFFFARMDKSHQRDDYSPLSLNEGTYFERRLFQVWSLANFYVSLHFWRWHCVVCSWSAVVLLGTSACISLIHSAALNISVVCFICIMVVQFPVCHWGLRSRKNHSTDIRINNFCSLKGHSTNFYTWMSVFSSQWLLLSLRNCVVFSMALMS